jgi:hypothetical protein
MRSFWRQRVPNCSVLMGSRMFFFWSPGIVGSTSTSRRKYNRPNPSPPINGCPYRSRLTNFTADLDRSDQLTQDAGPHLAIA